VPITILLVIGGLASGTFYPLCLSFIARNLPLSLITYGIAAYNLDLLATNHMTHALEGFFMDHWSWHWLFWNQAVFSIPMLFCVYRGIPDTPKEQLLPPFNYSGIYYLSGALTLFYIALDQGERLDWYNNGLINGLVIAGVGLLIALVVKRRYQPLRLLDFSYLRGRDVLIAAFMMIVFRILLVRVGFVIPLFLETLHQYRTTEIGALFALSVIPFIVALVVVAFFMNKIRVRKILTMGLIILALVNFYDAHTLSTWQRWEFLVSQLVGASGICLVAMGSIAAIVFVSRSSGAYINRAGAYAQGGFFQIVRLFGSVAAVSAFRRFLLFRDHFWKTKLVSDLQTTWPFDQRAAHLAVALSPQAAGPLQSRDLGVGLINHTVNLQAFTLAIDDTFMLLAWVCVIGLIGVGMMKQVPLPGDLPQIGAPPPPPKPTPEKVA
jgi:DHA2 family multidrug resistance protein